MQQKPRNPFQKVGVKVVAPSEADLSAAGLAFDNSQTRADSQRANPFRRTGEQNAIGDITAMLANPLTQFGIDYTKARLADISADKQSFLFNFAFNDKLRAHFQVEHRYVRDKLLFLLFPFLNIPGRTAENGGKEEIVRRTDLYIPLMALASFSLFTALKLILRGRAATPAALTGLAAKCLTLTAFEAFYLKFVLHGAFAVTLPFATSLALCAYKYVSLLFYWLFLGALPLPFVLRWLARLYMAISACHFLVK